MTGKKTTGRKARKPRAAAKASVQTASQQPEIVPVIQSLPSPQEVQVAVPIPLEPAPQQTAVEAPAECKPAEQPTQVETTSSNQTAVEQSS